MTENQKALCSFFENQGIDDQTFLSGFIEPWREYDFGKGDVITREGQVERHIYFVLNGIQKSTYTHHGKEHVIAFTHPGSFCSVPDSLYSQSPSRCTLSALTTSLLLGVEYQHFEEQIGQHGQLKNLFINMLKQVLVGVIGRHYELHAYSMEERFKVFYDRSKHLINQIPRKDIASYLNIDPTNLSKLLKKYSLQG